ncbi:MAG TPA: DUF6531 domain-containing protein, partial [Variovorax sp.]|nr:DUF6531 domain-containing protein [Variovorax sp.]
MTRFVRLACGFLAVLLWAGYAQAVIPLVPDFIYGTATYYSSTPAASAWRSDIQAACEAGAARAMIERADIVDGSPPEITLCSGIFGGDPHVSYGFQMRAKCKVSAGCSNDGYFLYAGAIFRQTNSSACPANSTFAAGAWCSCDSQNGFQEDASQTACVRAAFEAAPMCKVNRAAVSGISTPNPILPATAEKYRSETDFTDSSPAPLSFIRTYRSTWGADATRPAGSLGKAWAHNHTTALVATPAVNPNAASIISAEGFLRTFFKASGALTWSATNSADTLSQNADGSWSYRRADDDATLSFTADGKLQTLAPRNGWATVYTYNGAGQLATIGNGFGRTLVLTYNTAGQLVSVTTPDQRVIGYAYDTAGRLSVVTYPDAKTRTFLYENVAFPQALTGILDEAGARFATFAYDSQGRAIDSALAGSVDRYQVSYPSASSASILDPLGTSRSYSYSTTKGKLAVTGGSLPSGTGEADASSRVQDANGLITSETDFKGVVTTTTWDVDRRLPTTVVHASGT